MVKAGRSKGGKGKCGGSGSAPSSPTRRLKKGGKRGRRLCHMDGCTLCPSFGFEGDVAVSCSHHKEEGMRNLTARRCQHDGCFTVANFGMPGDKPGFCAAHSTEGMVNRNKPRGAEGMLAGVPIPRSSRRAAKANTAILEAAAAEAAKVADMAAVATSRNRGHFAPDLASGQGSPREILEGDCDGFSAARAQMTRARSSGRPPVSYREASDDEAAERNNCGDANLGRKKKAVGAKMRGHKPGERAAALAPGSSGTFVARGEDPPESVVTGSCHRRADGGRAGGGAIRARQRVGGKGLGTAAVTASVLHRPGATGHETLMSVPRAELEDLHLQGRYVDGGMVPMGAGGGGGGVGVGGRGGGGGGGANRMGRGGLGVHFPGGVMMHSGLLMDGACLESSALQEPLGMELDGGLEDLLRDDANALEAKASAADDLDRATRGGMMPSGVHVPHATMRSSASSLGLVGSSEGGIASNEVGLAADGDDDFDLDSLPELSGLDLARLHGVGQSPCIGGELRQGAPRTPVAAPGTMMGGSMGMRLGGGPSMASSCVTTIPSPASIGAESSGALPPPASSSSRPPPTTIAAAAAAAVAAVRSAPSISAAHVLDSVNTSNYAPGVLPSDDAWWDVLDGEEFVAMPEPVWGGNVCVQGLDEEPHRGHGDPRAWPGGAGGGPRVSGVSGLSPGCSTVEGGSGTGRDALEMLATDIAKTRSLLSSSPSLGGVLAMADDDFVGDSSRAGFPALPGACRLPADRGGSGDNGGGGGGGGGGGQGGGRLSLSPATKRHRRSVGDEPDPFPPPFNINTAGRPTKLELPPNSMFYSATAPALNSANFGAPVGFGLTVAPNTPLAQAAVHFQVNTPSSMPMTHGGGGGMRSAGGVQGGGVSKAWMPSDAISPSKCVSASPATSVHPPLGPQSSSPWGAAALHPPQQTQAAGRA